MAKIDFRQVTDLDIRMRMLLLLSGMRSQESLSVWLKEKHDCDISQATLSNWINGKVSKIAPDKYYLLNVLFSKLMGCSPQENKVLELDVKTFGLRLGLAEEKSSAMNQGVGDGVRHGGPLAFKTWHARQDEMEMLSQNLKGVYLGHSHSLRNNGKVTISLLFIDAFDSDKNIIPCRTISAGRYQYHGFITILKNELIYCLLEETAHYNEMIQMYFTTCGTNYHNYLYGILSGISGERPGVISATRILYERLDTLCDAKVQGSIIGKLTDYCTHTSPHVDIGDVDSAVGTIISNKLARSSGNHSSADGCVLRADTEAFYKFCEAIEDNRLCHPWMQKLLNE